MRLTRTRVLLAAAVVASAATIAGTALTASAAPAASHQVVLVNQCSGKGQVRPGPNIALPGCMTANELIGKAHWTSWGSAAFGNGDLEVNNCTPSSSCGPSKFTKYPILIVLWRAEHWQGGGKYFSRMTWIYTGNRPPHTKVTNTITWPAAAE
jgi:hypothetical protein